VDFPQFYDANYVELYLEGAPTNVETLLDNVSLIVGDDTTSGGSWEEDANSRIEQIRKSDLTISVMPPNDSNTANIKVEINPIRHRFPFGTALNGQLIKKCVENGVDDLYCNFAKENFNYVVLENAMKWQSMEPNRGDFRYENADITL